MWEFWILFIASNFMAGDVLAESWSYNINHLVLTFGQQLSIPMASATEKLEFTPTNNMQSYIIWSRNMRPQKAQVILTGDKRRFIIKSVTFDYQGNYTEWNFWDKTASVHIVKVLSKRRIQGCRPGKNLSISMDGLLKDYVKLQYTSKDFNVTLVEQGLPVGNTHPGYWGRIQVTTKNIEVLIVDGSDVGNYVLSDHENNTVMIVTLNMADCELKTNQLKLMHGEEFNIKLPIWFKKLEFSSMNEVQSVIWPNCAQHARRYIKEAGSQRQFIISPVTFNDQGTYTRWNYRNQVSSIYKLEVVCAYHVQDCEAGKTLSISLDGLSKEDVTLHFTSEAFNITLVENGLPVGNLHHFAERIQVTSSDIQVLNVDVSDVGNYTLNDREERTVKIVTPNLIYQPNPLLGLLVLLCIPPCIFCCYGNKIIKKCKRTTSTENAMKLENQNPLLASSPSNTNSEAPADSIRVKQSPAPRK